MKFQELFFDRLRAVMKPNLSAADQIADVLNMSKDAVYRRLRGDSPLTFDDAVKLATHFNVSLNSLEGNQNMVLFKRKPNIQSLEDFRRYLEDSLQLLEGTSLFRKKQMIYSAKDIPIFYQFKFRELGAFKMYVWLKSIYGVEKILGEHYSLKNIPDDILALGNKLWLAYSKIPCMEIWNDTTMLSLLKQVEYYYEAGMLASKEEALLICEQIKDMIRMIYKQTLTGMRLNPVDEDMETGIPYEMYVHELLIMDNHIIIEQDNQLTYLIPYAGVNYLSTRNPELCEAMRSYMSQQTKKSALITNFSEKERNKFFIKMRARVDLLIEKISAPSPQF
jgi:transcriptional regulator with XRE-family HTH domain